MKIDTQNQMKSARKLAFKLAVSATFTVEPLEESLRFWMQELDWDAEIEFAPYNQVFQQLLDPTSLLSQNQTGINIILIRFEDWQRYETKVASPTDSTERVKANVQDLVTALNSALGKSSIPHLLCFCPASPEVENQDSQRLEFEKMEAQMVAELSSFGNLYFLRSQDLAAYPVDNYYDPQRDQLGHIPFTPTFFTALGTAIARKLYAVKSPPHKVIVLDCDNTLWKGVVGEDGVDGIEFLPPWKALQTFMVEQQKAGMILCLCSKNNEPDVVEVFDKRSDLILKREHLVAWRINWLPKSENIKSLAAELNLGLDSFIFIDDNPVECAEVQASCPEVLSLKLPIDGDIVQFLHHVWAFDHLKVTAEDQKRTTLYQQNVERTRFQQQTTSIEDFLAGLQLNIEITEPTPDQYSRVAQLTQRTNQFNCTTIRRSEADIQALAEVGLECRMVKVSDRFGDYGIVGVMIFGTSDHTLKVDSFLLSCRVLGRGVEHRMLNHLGEVAKAQNCSGVSLPYIQTKKNLPALNFLEGVGADYKQPTDNGFLFNFPVEIAEKLGYNPVSQTTASTTQDTQKTTISANRDQVHLRKSDRLTRIATELYPPEQVLSQIESQLNQRQLEQPVVQPRTDAENQLAQLWMKLLRVETVGVTDNYFDLGGTSLLAVELFAQIESQWGQKLPLTTLVEAPTVEQLAKVLNAPNHALVRESVVRLHDGEVEPPLFLIHDGDGETLLYRNLARRLQPPRRVYGIQPYSREGVPMLHTRISDMAAYYIEQIRQVQPQGPYLLGGMCAGGVLSFEMAQQLQRQGQSVDMIAILDAADVEAPLRVGRIAQERLSNFSQVFAQGQLLKPHQRLLLITNKVQQKVTNLVRYEVQSKVDRFWTQLQMQLLRFYLDRGLSLPQFLKNLSVRKVYVFAESEYVPPAQFNGEVVLFRATQGQGNDQPFINVYSDPLLGWEKRATQGVKLYEVPGGHSSMLQEPHVKVLAQKMQAHLDQKLTEVSTSEEMLTSVRQ